MPEHCQDDHNAVSRRTFVRLGLMSAALAAGHPSLVAEETSSAPAVPYFGALRPLPPGAVLPEGWLKTWLQKQAAELGSHLSEVSWPFTEDYWGTEHQGAYFTPEQEYEVWWPWEQRAYWIDGATRLGLLLNQPDLLERTTKPITYTLTHPDTHGYLGPEVFEDPLADYHRWPHPAMTRNSRFSASRPTKLPRPSSITTSPIRPPMANPSATSTTSKPCCGAMPSPATSGC